MIDDLKEKNSPNDRNLPVRIKSTQTDISLKYKI